jgi:hypothetical protein
MKVASENVACGQVSLKNEGAPLEVLGDSLGTQKKAVPKSGKAHEMRSCMVVPTGLFPVKTGTYMPNNLRDLDRRPFGELT